MHWDQCIFDAEQGYAMHLLFYVHRSRAQYVRCTPGLCKCKEDCATLVLLPPQRSGLFRVTWLRKPGGTGDTRVVLVSYGNADALKPAPQGTGVWRECLGTGREEMHLLCTFGASHVHMPREGPKVQVYRMGLPSKSKMVR